MKGIGYRFLVFMSKRMIACDEASFLISYKEDHRLGFWRWVQLKMHLLSCHLCRKYARQIRELNSSLELYREKYNPETCQHHLSAEASAKILKALNSGLNAK